MNQPSGRKYRKLALAVLLTASGGGACVSFALPIDLATTPLGTATTGTAVRPNVMFILDASGSMNRDFVPDAVDPTVQDLGATAQTSYTCRLDSRGFNACQRGDPPYYADRFNGLSYNPQFTYKSGINADGTPRGDQRAWTAVPTDNYDPTFRYSSSDSKSVVVDLTTRFKEIGYCTSSSACTPRRNGIHNGTRFAYATPPKPGLTGVRFSRSALSPYTVTGTTTAANNVQVGDVIDVTGVGGCNGTAVKITAATANTFSYIYGDNKTQPTNCLGNGTVNHSVVGYPEATGPSFRTTALVIEPGRRTVGVVFPGHDFIRGDVIDVVPDPGGSNCRTGTGGAVVGLVTPAAFAFESTSASGPCAGTYTITRRPANIVSNLNGGPFYYTLSAVEHCSDLHLTDCVATSVPSPAYPFPAYVRYCNSLQAAAQPPSTASVRGPATCVDKFFAPSFIYPRYGIFTRGDIVSGVVYPDRPLRKDCANVPTCRYDEEMTNFANWFSYYRRRIQSMKTAAGLAFANVDASYRVGFVLIIPGRITAATPANCASSSFVALDTFDARQKQLFYCALYSQVPDGGTPLREALARVGRYYAHKTDGINAGMDIDPVQFSCQQNFAILTTDGLWRSSGGAPALQDGTQVGNVDGNAGLSSGVVSRAAGTFDGGCPDGNVNTSLTPGCANTLSDVALYYYKTDLRDPSLQNSAGFNGVDVSKNNVATTDRDPADWQHMVTYTVGLADGLMTWQKDYDTAEAGDFFNIKSGATGCFWSGTGICNWPTPIEDKPPVLDDLWHAAVNSHARYFHASDPGSLADALAGSLAGIKTTPGAASAAATSAPILNETDNSIFTTGYVTGDWTGELFAKTVKVVNGNLQITPKWQAHELLDATDAATRNILTFDTATADKIKPFTYDRLSATERQWVANVCVAPAKLSQCGTLSANEQATLNNGQTIVSFLRGSKANAGKIVRERKHVLGDIVDSTPAFVSAPAFKFADAVTPSYGKFKTDQASRQKMLYVGANDGMLHAFNADTGVEVWAYVPRMLIPKMHLLADVNYARNHTFFVDGAPAVMDAFFGDTWHTVLVGGLNAGGRGFYALDVTVPSAPHALWEFCSDSTCEISDPDLGLSFGNPIITKRNGEPVVLLTSGYNNISPGSGQEILYVVNLASGRFEKVTTGSGTIENPGGLAKIAAWADNFQLDNTTQYVYGGDLAGNVWRFDLTSSQTSVMPLATLSDANGKPQPVTTRPELGFVKNQRVVYIGTGRLLGLTDVPDLSQQTLYAFKDTGAPLGNLRTSNKLVKQTLNARDENTRTAVGTAVDWTSQNGWFVDFNPGNTSPGERVNIDPQLTLGTLTVHTNVPLADPCSVGGESWLYQFAYDTGLYVATAPGQIVGQRLAGSTVVGFVIIGVPGAGLKEFATDALRRNPIIPVPVANGPAMGRRIGWREITR